MKFVKPVPATTDPVSLCEMAIDAAAECAHEGGQEAFSTSEAILRAILHMEGPSETQLLAEAIDRIEGADEPREPGPWRDPDADPLEALRDLVEANRARAEQERLAELARLDAEWQQLVETLHELIEDVLHTKYVVPAHRIIDLEAIDEGPAQSNSVVRFMVTVNGWRRSFIAKTEHDQRKVSFVGSGLEPLDTPEEMLEYQSPTDRSTPSPSSTQTPSQPNGQ